MENTTPQPADVPSADEMAVRALYRQMLEGWNARSGEAFAAPYAEDGAAIGFDGSEHSGRAAMAADMQRIFANHPTARYVAKVRSVRPLGDDAAILRAIAGLVPPGQTDIAPQLNAHQTIVAARRDGRWQIVLLQNTPAQFPGRPEVAQQLTDELRQML